MLDHFGLRPVTPEMAEDLHDLILEHYERKPLLLSSTPDARRMADVFVLLASAALDRLTYDCHVLLIRADSYSQRQRPKENQPISH